MFFLQILFIVMAVINLVLLFFDIRVKRPNIGFVFTTALIFVTDIICFLLLDCSTIRDARSYLSGFYVVYSLLFFGVAWTLADMGFHRHRIAYLIPPVAVCFYQIALIIANFSTRKMLAFSRHILSGRLWWVAEASPQAGFFASFNMYRVLVVINSLYLFALVVIFGIQTVSMYKVKYYVLFILQLVLSLVGISSMLMVWPVWVLTIVINVVAFIVFYLVNFFSGSRLRDWAMNLFANEMSDGLLLYDEHDDLLHMNDLLKNTLSEDILRSFKEKDNAEKWVSGTVNIDGLEVLVYDDGAEKHYFKVRINEFAKEHRKIATTYMLHDATDSVMQMKIMEEANTELERAAKMKSDFLANMSHEIRTPMNAVIGMAEIALREDLPPHVVDCLTQIQHSGKNLLNIINDILDFSKIEAGKMEIVPDAYEPLSEINDISNILSTRIGEKDIELFFTVDPDIPHVLYGDAMRIRQILVNIANNAIKFTDHGYVRIDIKCEEVDEENVNISFHVKDTGHGIKEEDLKKLFVSFQQVDSKRNRKVEGTGLGLAISKSLCEAMGGTIGVESEYGEGSDFYFTIPQKVKDARKDLVVDKADEKFAYCLNVQKHKTDMFAYEMDMLGVENRLIGSLDEYVPTGKDDILFFEYSNYTPEVKEFLDNHRDVDGVVLVSFDSQFQSDRPNLRIMRKPLTTLAMVLVMNNMDISELGLNAVDTFKIDYIAPDAKVMIVDDNSINLTIAQGLMDPLKIKCTCAISGFEAIELAEKEQFDIILMDHMMPGLDGVETTRKLRSEVASAADTPIIALTANVMEGAREMFLNVGMNDLIAKPIDIRELVTKLKLWLPAERIIPISEEEAEGTGDVNEALHFDCLDCERAVATLGSQQLFETIVGEYYRSGSEAMDAIQRAFDDEDWGDYTRRVHTLKSASRQIGAFDLGDMAEELEKAGNAEDVTVIKQGTEPLLQRYSKLLEDLSVYFPEEIIDESDLMPITDEKIKELFEKLTEACDALDMDSMDEVGEELSKYSYPENMKDDIGKLRKAIERIDAEACLEIMSECGGVTK